MIRRRNTINIYDYPEHLNPFREDADEKNEFSTTGRRSSSFRVNAWNVFSSDKGKSKASEDINPVSSSVTSRFMTWTPKLLRKASFRQSSPPRARPPVSQETLSRLNARLSFRSTISQSTLPPTSSRSSLPPSSSRSALHSRSSRSTLPADDSRAKFSSSRPTSPPSRPALPHVCNSLSPSRPLSPMSINLAVTSSTEHAPNSRHTTPVHANRKVFTPALPSEKTVGEQPSGDDSKYIQQGAKPKKKRRAPAPPTPSPGKSASDNRQVNSNESDASMTSSVASSSAEEPLSHEQRPLAHSDFEVTAQETELGPKKGESGQSDGTVAISSENRIPERNSENGLEHPGQSTNTHKDPEEFEFTHVNGLTADGGKMRGGKDVVRNGDETTVAENAVIQHLKHDEHPSPESEDDIGTLQHTPEDEPQGNRNQTEDGNRRQQNWGIHNSQRNPENGLTEHRNELEDSVQDTLIDVELPDPPTQNNYRLHNGKEYSSENVELQNGKDIKQVKPEAKVRTILPNKTKK